MNTLVVGIVMGKAAMAADPTVCLMEVVAMDVEPIVCLVGTVVMVVHSRMAVVPVVANSDLMVAVASLSPLNAHYMITKHDDNSCGKIVYTHHI